MKINTKSTKLSELGLGGRLLTSCVIGFTTTLALMAATLFGMAHRGGLGYVFVIPTLPGIVMATIFPILPVVDSISTCDLPPDLVFVALP